MPPKGYRHLSVKEEVYRRLEEFAERKGLSSVADALVVLLDYADIYSKIEYILQKGVSLPQTGVREALSSLTNTASTSVSSGVQATSASSSVDAKHIAPNIAPNVASNIAPNMQPPATSAPNIGTNIGVNVAQATERRRSGHVWCEKKARIRNLQGFLKWVEKTYGLVDYWDEGDRYCFETLEPPKKEKAGKRKHEEGEVEAEELE
jgi:hypothetical protein